MPTNDDDQQDQILAAIEWENHKRLWDGIPQLHPDYVVINGRKIFEMPIEICDLPKSQVKEDIDKI